MRSTGRRTPNGCRTCASAAVRHVLSGLTHQMRQSSAFARPAAAHIYADSPVKRAPKLGRANARTVRCSGRRVHWGFGCLNCALNWLYCARWQARRGPAYRSASWVEYWFDVDHRGAVERFEFADQDPQALDREDLGPVQADRVGRLGERVLNTPSGGLAGLSPGTVASSSRRARSSQVSTMICCPACRSPIASARSGSTAGRAGGAPSLPCRGACARCFSGDSTQPTGLTSYRCVACPVQPAGGLAPAVAPSELRCSPPCPGSSSAPLARAERAFVIPGDLIVMTDPARRCNR